MAAPTALEYKLLETFRHSIRDLGLQGERAEDMFLLTWIRAREHDLTKAEDMLRKSVAWQQNNDIDNIASWPTPDSYVKAFHCSIPGYDKDGRPVIYLPLGSWQVRTVVEAGERQIYIRYVDQLIASFVKAAHTATHTQFLIILDMTGLTLRQFTSRATVDTILETFRRFESNYPETLFLAFVINAPRIFPIVFNIVKPLLSQHTRNKVKIFNSNPSKWREALGTKMSPETFPKQLQVPVMSPLDDNANLESKIERQIEAGGKLEVKLNLELNSLLTWEFSTVDYDLGFTLKYAEVDVIPYKRYNSHEEPVIGTFLCETEGKHTLIFDNSYSRYRAKTVTFKYSIEREKMD